MPQNTLRQQRSSPVCLLVLVLRKTAKSQKTWTPCSLRPRLLNFLHRNLWGVFSCTGASRSSLSEFFLSFAGHFGSAILTGDIFFMVHYRPMSMCQFRKVLRDIQVLWVFSQQLRQELRQELMSLLSDSLPDHHSAYLLSSSCSNHHPGRPWATSFNQHLQHLHCRCHYYQWLQGCRSRREIWPRP